jgi:excisionase family DNA binding protein
VQALVLDVRGHLRRCPEMPLRCPRPITHGDRVAPTSHHVPNRSPALGVGSGLTRDQVMTAAEVAELLQLPISTVYYLARRGEIPACRVGRAWRFLRTRLEEMLGS